MTPIAKSIYSCGIAKILANFHLSSTEHAEYLVDFCEAHAFYYNKAYPLFTNSTHCRVKDVTILLRDTTEWEKYPVFMLSDHNTELADFINAIGQGRTRGTRTLNTGYFYSANKSKSTLLTLNDEKYKTLWRGAKYRDDTTAIYHNFVLRFLTKKATPKQIIDSLETVIPYDLWGILNNFVGKVPMTLESLMPVEDFGFHFPYMEDIADKKINAFLQKEEAIIDSLRQKTFIYKVTA